MQRIKFKDSEVFELIQQSLKEFYKLTNNEVPHNETFAELLKLYKYNSVIYLSSWLEVKGFKLLEELETYEFSNTKEYKSYCGKRRVILEFDIEMKDVDMLFTSVTELIGSALRFLKENSCKTGDESRELTSNSLSEKKFSSDAKNFSNWGDFYSYEHVHSSNLEGFSDGPLFSGNNLLNVKDVAA